MLTTLGLIQQILQIILNVKDWLIGNFIFLEHLLSENLFSTYIWKDFISISKNLNLNRESLISFDWCILLAFYRYNMFSSDEDIIFRSNYFHFLFSLGGIRNFHHHTSVLLRNYSKRQMAKVTGRFKFSDLKLIYLSKSSPGPDRHSAQGWLK